MEDEKPGETGRRRDGGVCKTEETTSTARRKDTNVLGS